MDPTDETTSVLLLDRSQPLVESQPLAESPQPLTESQPMAESQPPAGEEDLPPAHLDDRAPHDETLTPVVASSTDFRGPLLGALAAASILVGYRWIGVIPVSNTGPSSVAFGRAGALVFALLALWLAWAAGRAKGTASGDHRSRTVWLLVLAATASTLVAAALTLRDITVLRYTFGVSELLVASVAGTLLLVDERRRRRAGPNLRAVSSSRSGHHGATAT
jgi:hypothetical protein